MYIPLDSSSDFAVLAITRIVDGRCSSLPNPGITKHPILILFGRGPPDTKLTFLDNSLLNGSTQVMNGGAWSIRLTAKAGIHSFSVCTSSGLVSSSWEINIDITTSTPRRGGSKTLGGNVYPIKRQIV
jgi:hypothetical protein